MKAESDLRRAFVVAIRSTKNIAQPIESGTTGLGIPDLFVRTSKVSAWIELKNMKYPLSYPFVVPFRPGQYAWLMAYHQHGGAAMLGIGTPDGVFVFKGDNISKVYHDRLENCCDLHMRGVRGKEFVEWMDMIFVQK